MRNTSEIIKGENVIGNFDFWDEDTGCGNKLLYNINEFKPIENNLTLVELRNAYTDPIKQKSKSWCPIGDSRLILLHGSFTKAISSLQILGLNSRHVPNNPGIENTYSSKLIGVPLELQRLEYHILTRVAHNKFLLIGGLFWTAGSDNQPNQFLWQGVVTHDETDVVWEKIHVGFLEVRQSPICFTLKDNLFIVCAPTSLYSKTFLCCDRYNLKERKYYKSAYLFPYSQRCGSRITNIVTDDEESFAIIASYDRFQRRRMVKKLLIFTENGGFEEVPIRPVETSTMVNPITYNGTRTLIKFK